MPERLASPLPYRPSAPAAAVPQVKTLSFVTWMLRSLQQYIPNLLEQVSHAGRSPAVVGHLMCHRFYLLFVIAVNVYFCLLYLCLLLLCEAGNVSC